MRRTVREPVPPEPPYAPLIRAIQHLDAVLKQGISFGVENENVILRDEDLTHATARVRQLLDSATHDMDRLAKAIMRAQPGTRALN
jgi:hypothetical protein